MTTPQIQKDIPLASLTNFKIGGPAKFFLLVQENDELTQGVEYAKKQKLPITVIGHGTNILVPDQGIDGLVIQVAHGGYTLNEKTGFLTAEAGTAWTPMIQALATKGWAGLEWGVGIPGTVGGAVFGNIGAFGGEIKNTVKKVTVLKKDSHEIEEYSSHQCGFAYRHSTFKTTHDIILSVQFQLRQDNPLPITQQIQETLKLRREKHEIGYPTCGSYFKNMFFDQFPSDKQEELLSSKVAHLAKKYGKVPTGFLIETCDLKGKQAGGAKIAEKHANFIINYKNATAQDVLDLAQMVKEQVWKRWEVQIEEEVQYLAGRI